MANSAGRQELRVAFKRLERSLPPRVATKLRWLRHPASRWVRVPSGVALVVGGVFSFLPVLGVWMLPLGLMLVASDVPVLRRPMARFTMWAIDRVDAFGKRSS
ncbi:hypothetical protein [Bosea sp. 124]|uniref:hypothetical protein n=1 Tax=Bosea sp. 124 TaxID=2135642 RepID=UPI000D3404C2|nr:hypothetical protein [Bosea sp. 124]PTM41656.1 hypothetical protein C8D03_3225 [Bosea sp. 124]